MGAGKTSVGRELAKGLAWEFLDLDDVIEAVERRTVPEIFAAEGEPHFRTIERRELERVLRERTSPTILSVGGGAFAEAGSAELVGRYGAISVLLDAPVEELRRRVNSSENHRPLAQHRERFLKLYGERQQAYARAQQRFDTAGKTVEQVAREIADWVRNKFASTGHKPGDGGNG